MTINKPEITVIIIGYNVAQWIHRCLDSLLAQNYKNFVTVVVDDGSIDSTRDICDEYSKKDSRIKVFHTSNQGVSSARNLGLSKVDTTWFTFIDADDYVHPQYLSNLLLPTTKRKNIDLVQCSYFVKIENNKSPQHCVKSTLYTNDMEDILSHIRGFVWSKLFKSSLIREYKIHFDQQISLAEDLCFVLDYLQYADMVCFSEQAEYVYEKRTGSVSKCRHKPEALYQQFHVEFKLIERLTQRTSALSYSTFYRKKLLASSLMNYITSLYIGGYKSENINKIKNIPVQELNILKYFSSTSRIKKIISILLFKQQWKLSDILLFSIYRLKQISNH